jgi:hypothetical protein
MAWTLWRFAAAQLIFAAAVRAFYVSEYEIMEGHNVMNEYSLPLPSSYLSDDVRTYSTINCNQYQLSFLLYCLFFQVRSIFLFGINF